MNALSFNYIYRQLMFSFQIWNNIVAPQHLQSEHIRDTWNKSIHDSLAKTMQLKVGVDLHRDIYEMTLKIFLVNKNWYIKITLVTF